MTIRFARLAFLALFTLLTASSFSASLVLPHALAAPEGTSSSPQGEPRDRQLRVKPRPTRTSKEDAQTRPAKPAPKENSRARKNAATGDAIVARAQEAAAAGRSAEARQLLEGLDRSRLPADKADEAAYLEATLTEEGAKQGSAFLAYLKDFSRGRHRREATLALARLYYVEGDYAEAERLLTIFSPGIEKDRVGRQGLVLRGLSQLARGDATGALQFFSASERDVKGSAEEEAYYFATAQAGLRSGKAPSAVEALRVLLERHAQGAYAPQALYAMGMALEQLGRASDATNVFRQVVQRFPESYEATRVRDRGIRPGGVVASGLPIGGGYALQIGAFSRRDLADALARDLRLANVPDISVKQGNESPPLYRVRAGAFASRDEARALGERLRRERGFSFTVVPH